MSILRTSLQDAFQLWEYIKVFAKVFPRSVGFSTFSFVSGRNAKIASIVKAIQSFDFNIGLVSNREVSDNIIEVAAEAKKTLGVYPISFSWPGSWLETANRPRPYKVATIIPGNKYEYDVEDDYYFQYQESAAAITFKKAGWDCFRHLEIISNGALPLMPDIDSVPRFTMIHYPKEMMSEALKSMLRGTDISWLTTSYLKQLLSSESMASYILNLASYRGGDVLFIDNETSYLRPDYLSSMTYIGLARLLGDKLIVSHRLSYLYDDFDGDTGEMYGRGFGYTRQLLEDQANQVWDGLDSCKDWRGQWKPQIVVFGRISQHRDLLSDLLQRWPSSATQYVFLRGSDFPPSRSDLSKLRALPGPVFSRELY